MDGDRAAFRARRSLENSTYVIQLAQWQLLDVPYISVPRDRCTGAVVEVVVHGYSGSQASQSDHITYSSIK